MYAQCPACQTIYKVNSADLAEMGLVNCGECGAIIQVTEVLRDNVPNLAKFLDSQLTQKGVESVDAELDDAPGAEITQETLTPISVEFSDDPRIEEDESVDIMVADEEEFSAIVDEDPPLDKIITTPEFVAPHAHNPKTTSHPILLGTGIFAAVLVLLVSLAYVNKPYLSSIDAIKPFVAMLCFSQNCESARERQADKIRLINRDIRKHPSVQGALIISATMINDAKQAQPYPQLEIQLSNYQSESVAMRRFAPDEYLKSSVNINNLMQPGVLVPVSFETVDPGDDAISFEFKFH